MDRKKVKEKFLLKTICIGDEVYGEVYMEAECESNGTVVLKSNIKLFESDKCPNTDLDGFMDNIELKVPADSEKNLPTKKVRNDKEDDDDLLYFSYKASNKSVKKK